MSFICGARYRVVFGGITSMLSFWVPFFEGPPWGVAIRVPVRVATHYVEPRIWEGVNRKLCESDDKLLKGTFPKTCRCSPAFTCALKLIK